MLTAIVVGLLLSHASLALWVWRLDKQIEELERVRSWQNVWKIETTCAPAVQSESTCVTAYAIADRE